MTADLFISAQRVAPQNSLPRRKNIWPHQRAPPIKMTSSFHQMEWIRKRIRAAKLRYQNEKQPRITSAPWIPKFARIIWALARNAAWRLSQPFQFNQPQIG